MSGPFFAEMDHPAASNEWCDFDCLPDLDSFYLDSEPASALSFSPLESTLDTEVSLHLDSALCMQSSLPGFASYDPAQEEEHFHNVLSDLGASCDAGLQFNEALPIADIFMSGSPFDQTLEFASQYVGAQAFPPSSIRQLVEATAAADTRRLSWKEKLREASIAIHLKRLMDFSAAEIDLSSKSNTTFSSPTWSDFVQDTDSPQSTSFTTTTATMTTSSGPSSKASPSPSAASALEHVSGGVEIVLDLNMNTATDLPKKQKPRSQAQRESYKKIRKHGACEKHRKQHKRCNCLDKNPTPAGTSAAHARPPTQLPHASMHHAGVAKVSGLPHVSNARQPDCAVTKVSSPGRAVRLRTTATDYQALLANRTPYNSLHPCPHDQSRPLGETHASGQLPRPTKDCSAILRDLPGRSSYRTTAGTSASSRARLSSSTAGSTVHSPAVSRVAVSGSPGSSSSALAAGRMLPQCGVSHARRSAGCCSGSVAAPQTARVSERSLHTEHRATISRPSSSSGDFVHRHLGPVSKQTRNSVLVEGAGAVIQAMALACTTWWRTSISRVDSTVSILQKVAVASCRSFLLVRKGLRAAMW